MDYILDSITPQLRILLTVVTSLAIVLFSGVYFLPFLHRLKYGQSIRAEGQQVTSKRAARRRWAA